MTDFNPEQVGESLMDGLRQAQAMLSHAMEPERFEYALITWDKVNPMAREGWALVPMGPVFGFTPAGMGFVMVRKLGAADEAAALLEQRPADMQP